MTRKLIAIDGASRRNGKEDCVAAGGIFMMEYDEDSEEIVRYFSSSTWEWGSTNQRGEMLALKLALLYVDDTTIILTDSEYILNCMTKEWVDRWKINGWFTSEGKTVANQDLWSDIWEMYNIVDSCRDVAFLHIKGHLMPFGKVGAAKLMEADPTGKLMYEACLKKFDLMPAYNKGELQATARESSERNHGLEYGKQLRMFVCANVVADAIATSCVEAADKIERK